MRILLLFVLTPFFLFAESFLISDIPIPKTYIQDLDPYECQTDCLQEFVDQEMIFSFLAHAQSKLEDPTLDELRMMSVNILNLGSAYTTKEIKIALLLPYKVIGRYATSTTNASFAYLLAKNHSFELKSYKLETQEQEEIEEKLKEIKNDGFEFVIAPLTQEGANALAQTDTELYTYFPTIHKKDINSSSEYLIYGGIDYKAQIDLLLEEAASPLVIFHDGSLIGKNLSSYETFKYKENFQRYLQERSTQAIQEDLITEVSQTAQGKIIKNKRTDKVISFVVPHNVTNLEKQLKENEALQLASVFINTPVIKSGMIMSQLTLYDTNATNVLSTQINYDPLLLSMTQYKDRKNMIVANSITEDHNIFIETNTLLSNDIVYDWINYTTTVGIDYFFHLMSGANREYSIDIQENQMIYEIELLRPSMSKFIPHTPLLK